MMTTEAVQPIRILLADDEPPARRGLRAARARPRRDAASRQSQLVPTIGAPLASRDAYRGWSAPDEDGRGRRLDRREIATLPRRGAYALTTDYCRAYPVSISRA